MSDRKQLEELINSYLFGSLNTQVAQKIEEYFKQTLKSNIGEQGYSIIENPKNMTYDLHLDSTYMSEDDLMELYAILAQK